MNGLYFALLVVFAVGYALLPFVHGPAPRPDDEPEAGDLFDQITWDEWL